MIIDDLAFFAIYPTLIAPTARLKRDLNGDYDKDWSDPPINGLAILMRTPGLLLRDDTSYAGTFLLLLTGLTLLCYFFLSGDIEKLSTLV